LGIVNALALAGYRTARREPSRDIAGPSYRTELSHRRAVALQDRRTGLSRRSAIARSRLALTVLKRLEALYA